MNDDFGTPMRVGDVAARISAEFGLPTELIARRIRGFVQSNLVEVVHEGHGDNAPALFDARAACAVSLFVFLAQINFDARSLKHISEIIYGPYLRASTPDVVGWAGQLGAAMSGVEKGEVWLLRIEYRVRPDDPRIVTINGQCHRADDEPTDATRQIIAAQRFVKGEEVEGAVTQVRLNPIFAPFVKTDPA